MPATPNGKSPSSLLAKIKEDIAKSAQARSGVFYLKKDQSTRIRFLMDFESGVTIPWHSKWANNKNEVDSPCLKAWGKDCPFCGQPEVRTTDKYVWQVYNYERKERQLFCYAANRATPVLGVSNVYQNPAYGTLLNNDLVVTKNGEGTQTTYSVQPNPAKAFRVEGIKVLSETRLKLKIWEAFGTDSLDKYPDLDEEFEEEDEEEEYDEEEEEEVKPVKKKVVAVASTKKKIRR